MRCSRRIPATPGRRWRWPRWSTPCGRIFCGLIRPTRSGRTATGSCCLSGHASTLLYAMLHLTGVTAVDEKYERLGTPAVALDDLEAFPPARQQMPGPSRISSDFRGRDARPVRSAKGSRPASAWRSRRIGWPRISTGPGSICSITTCIALCGDGCMMEGVEQRGGVARRPSAARQSDLDLRQQPHHDRGKYRARLQRGRGRAVSRLWLACSAGQRRQ